MRETLLADTIGELRKILQAVEAADSGAMRAERYAVQPRAIVGAVSARNNCLGALARIDALIADLRNEAS